jgi:hypothetical protein
MMTDCFGDGNNHPIEIYKPHEHGIPCLMRKTMTMMHYSACWENEQSGRSNDTFSPFLMISYYYDEKIIFIPGNQGKVGYLRPFSLL